MLDLSDRVGSNDDLFFVSVNKLYNGSRIPFRLFIEVIPV